MQRDFAIARGRKYDAYLDDPTDAENIRIVEMTAKEVQRLAATCKVVKLEASKLVLHAEDGISITIHPKPSFEWPSVVATVERSPINTSGF